MESENRLLLPGEKMHVNPPLWQAEYVKWLNPEFRDKKPEDIDFNKWIEYSHKALETTDFTSNEAVIFNAGFQAAWRVWKEQADAIIERFTELDNENWQ